MPLCEVCRGLLSLLEPLQRCVYCFCCLDGGYVCHKCREQVSPFKRVAATFDYQGPSASLIQLLKFSNAPYLAKHLAAFMVVQWTRLSWPLPDFIVPVPLSLMHFFKRGYNQSKLLAEEMGQLMGRPVLDVLKRSSESFSQMGQDRQQREQLSRECFSWKKYQPLEGKVLLLVDDVMTTGTTLRHSGSLLEEAFPKSIYALTTCLA
jgi:competence protein ComFC